MPLPAAEHLSYKSENLKPVEELFLALIKLRRNKENLELALLFSITQSVALQVFHTWINFLYFEFKDLNFCQVKEIIE